MSRWLIHLFTVLFIATSAYANPKPFGIEIGKDTISKVKSIEIAPGDTPV